MCRSCQHFTDAERSLERTCFIDEVRLAITNGYKIVEIHEIYEYRVTRCNPETGEGGLFVGYINTFLKLKAETSGFPSWFEHRTMKTDTSRRSGKARESA